jgi:hypothetical protein
MAVVGTDLWDMVGKARTLFGSRKMRAARKIRSSSGTIADDGEADRLRLMALLFAAVVFLVVVIVGG